MSILCSDPYGYGSQINPFCWSIWEQDATGSDLNSCEKASGGNADLYLRCVGQKAATQAGMAQNDPTGAADFQAATNSPISLLNPFSGSGGAIIPSWVWLVGAGVLGLVLIRR